MLFHLKEPEYATKEEPHERVRFYARKPDHIFETLAYYHRQVEEKGYTQEELPWWAQRQFTEQDIEEVEQGRFYFFNGVIHDSEKEELFMPVPIVGEFTLHIPEEQILSFLEWRPRILANRRGHLYKLQNSYPFKENISFVPEDIAFALCANSFFSYQDAIKKEAAFRQSYLQNRDSLE